MTEAQIAHEEYKRILYLRMENMATKEEVDQAYKKWCDIETRVRGS